MDRKRIAVIRLSALGDIIHTLPAVQLLKKELPGTEITWFVEKGNKKLLECFEPFVKIEGVSLKKRGFFAVLKEVKRLRKEFRGKFDLIVDFQGLIKSSFLALIIGKRRVGFNRLNLREKFANVFYTEKSIAIDKNKHIIFKNIEFIKNILDLIFNIKSNNKIIEYPKLIKYDDSSLNEFFNKNKLRTKEFVLLNIGGGWETKRLNFMQYESVLNHLKKSYIIIILWGNDKEKEIAEKLSIKCNVPMTDFLNFNELFSIIKDSKFIITSDTLALHIADLVNTKSIGIFGPTSPIINGSIYKSNSVVYKNLECSPCHKRKCPNLKCIDSILPEDIIDAVKKLKY